MKCQKKKKYEKKKHIYVGVDTHKRTHTAVIINSDEEELGEITFENKPSSFDELLKEVTKYKKRGITPIFGLEDTGGVGRALAVYLLDNKYEVKNVNSSLSSSERKNKASRDKSDRIDALCVAKVLVRNINELHNANPQDIFLTLTISVNDRNSLVKASITIKNQIHSRIVNHYPSYRKFFTVFDCKSALAFWETYPSPSKLKDVTAIELGNFLKTHSSGFFSVKKANEILEYIKADGDTTTELQESRDVMISNAVRRLRQNNEEIKIIDNKIKDIMRSLEYKLETMIGVDLVTAASFIAEIGDIGRFESADRLAKYAGIAPIMNSSGDKHRFFRNRQGNRNLYELFKSLALRQICRGRNKDKPVNAIFYDYYKKKISEGKTEHQAIICIMRRLVNIIYGMMKNKAEYKRSTLSNT